MKEFYLFLDTCAYIQVGLIEESGEWIDYEYIENSKGSKVLHDSIYCLLTKNEFEISQCKGLVLASGPGSYTGIRLGEGLAQVLELHNIPVYSFYHFEVPAMCGIEEYRYYAQAFKGEVFCAFVNNFEVTSELVSEEHFYKNVIDKDFSTLGTILEHEHCSVYPLFKKDIKKIFDHVIKRAKHLSPYYFRALEKEFKVSQKI